MDANNQQYGNRWSTLKYHRCLSLNSAVAIGHNNAKHSNVHEHEHEDASAKYNNPVVLQQRDSTGSYFNFRYCNWKIINIVLLSNTFPRETIALMTRGKNS